MGHEFREWEHEPETQAASSRGGGPPRKMTGVGVLDPPVPPRRSRGPSLPIPASWVVRIFSLVILIGVVAGVVMMLLRR